MLLIGSIEYLTIYRRSWARGQILYYGFLLDGGFICPVIAMVYILLYLQRISQTKSRAVSSRTAAEDTSNGQKNEAKSSSNYPSGAIIPGNY